MASNLPGEIYTYTPLDPTKQEIRLITLHPNASLDAPVTITLSSTSLLTNPSYEAISYVWGDPHITAPIALDGFSVEVTTNLETALRYMRLDSEIRILWVDAICINQKDDLEKNHQVGMMGDIYRSCTKCLAWLGEDVEGDGKETFEMLKVLAAGIDFPFSDPFLDCKNLLEHPRTRFICLYNVMQRAYWRRLWILQETVLPARAEYWCGRSIIDRNVWIGAKRPLAHLGEFRRGKSCGTCDDATYKFIHEPASMLTGKSSTSTYQPSGIPSILYNTRHSLCENPLDKVFAVLALMRPADRSRFIVDYKNTSLNRLSADVINVEATQYGTLSMLGLIDVLILEGKPKCPSWWPFPQWNTNPRLAFQYNSESSQEHKLRQDIIFKACGSSEALLDLGSVEEGVLGVLSILVDTIESTQTWKDLENQLLSVPSMEQAGRRIDLHGEQEFTRGLQNDLKHAQSVKQGRLLPALYVGGGTIGNAWWRALVSDSITTENMSFKRAQESEEKMFWNVWTKLYSIPADGQPAVSEKGPEDRLMSALGRSTYRSIITTQKVYFGTAPISARPGDEVHIIGGSNWPLLLRKVSEATATSPATYLCLGKCYLHGIMDGEVAENFVDRATRINLV
ncbi:hypothetical protein VTL71DRAFT_3462 [Oculimacula yallundae]|uniref:Heterokaryon incompatibility domain-containing protein n=1 Tax=Oculimacula yallundae TaxID=86028 RepID=A0ABR4C8E3_9HELO